MAEIIEHAGVPKDAVLVETKALDTHQHALNLHEEFTRRGFKRVLLVTSAMHMPRSLAVMRRGCPGIEFVAMPTDFHFPDPPPESLAKRLARGVPGAKHLEEFTLLMHEYVGMLYYWLRGWV